MGIAQSYFTCRCSKEEDEQQRQRLYPFLVDNNNNYKKPYNGASFGSSSLYPLSKNLLLRIFNLLPFAKSRKAEPILPVVNPTNYPPFLQIQDSSSSSPDSSSSPNTIYVPGPDSNLQLQSDHYSSSKDGEISKTGSNGNEDEGLHYIKQVDVKIDVPNLDYQSLAHRGMYDVVDSAYLSIQKEENEVEEVEEEKVMINCCVRVEGKWIKHYHSSHRILLVGEGDFSFSASLALAFGTASNMIATSLDSRKFLKENYGTAMVNIKNLTSRDGRVVHGIDATQIAYYAWLGGMKFDRIIYNFPFAGFFKGLSRDKVLKKHRRLVSLFLKNAKELVVGNGEIHITHKTNNFHNEWKLESMASSHGLRLIEAPEFNLLDYPGYNTKRGFGGDDNFDCDPAKTYKFGPKK